MSNAGFFISLLTCFREHHRMFCRRCLQHAQADMTFKSVMCIKAHWSKPHSEHSVPVGDHRKVKDASCFVIHAKLICMVFLTHAGV